MVGATGFEPATSWSQTKCSSQAELRSDEAPIIAHVPPVARSERAKFRPAGARLAFRAFRIRHCPSSSPLLPPRSVCACNRLRLQLTAPWANLDSVSQPHTEPDKNGADICPQPFLCPLSQVNAGVAVRIKQLSASPEVTHRLRELGFCEEQKIRLLSRQSSIICQVCNARLGISARLAERILVEPLTRQKVA